MRMIRGLRCLIAWLKLFERDFIVIQSLGQLGFDLGL